MHMWDKFTMKEGLATKGGKPAINFEQFQELISHASPEIRPGSKYVAFLFKIFDRDRDGRGIQGVGERVLHHLLWLH